MLEDVERMEEIVLQDVERTEEIVLESPVLWLSPAGDKILG